MFLEETQKYIFNIRKPLVPLLVKKNNLKNSRVFSEKVIFNTQRTVSPLSKIESLTERKNTSKTNQRRINLSHSNRNNLIKSASSDIFKKK